MFQQAPPIVVRVVEQRVHETSIADLILGSLATVAMLLLIAALLGVLLGGLIIAIKRLRHRDELDPDDAASSLRITPTAGR